MTFTLPRPEPNTGFRSYLRQLDTDAQDLEVRCAARYVAQILGKSSAAERLPRLIYYTVEAMGCYWFEEGQPPASLDDYDVPVEHYFPKPEILSICPHLK
jgi:hypothetical protein